MYPALAFAAAASLQRGPWADHVPALALGLGLRVGIYPQRESGPPGSAMPTEVIQPPVLPLPSLSSGLLGQPRKFKC